MPTMTLIITERRTETPESKSDETHNVGSMLQRWEAASGPVLECARQDIPLRRRLRREKAAIRNHSADPDCHVASRSTGLHRAHWSRLGRVPRAPASTSSLRRYFFDLVHETVFEEEECTSLSKRKQSALSTGKESGNV